MHRYGINFISNKCIIGGKNENNGEYLIEKFNNSNFSIGINNIDNEENENEEEKNNNSSSEDNDNINNKINNTCKKNYFSYEKLIFYEGIICFAFWFLFVFFSSFIKCPENNESFSKMFFCNNCTTMSGYESFFNSKEMIVYNNFKYKSEIVQFIINHPLITTFIFIIIIIVTEFLEHFSFHKIFLGKYKTKLIILISPLVSLLLFVIGYLFKKYLNTDSFFDQVLPNIITSSEIIVCISLFVASILSYLRICELNC